VLGKIGVLTAEPAASPPTGNGHAGQAIGTEKVFAEVLHVERVPVDSHFFDDLGAESMVMAQFCARVGKRADLPSVSMKDVYPHPTISSLGGNPAQEMPEHPAVRPASLDGVFAPLAVPEPRQNGRHRASRELAGAWRPAAALQATAASPRHRGPAEEGTQ
jgi:hypothetical protein